MLCFAPNDFINELDEKSGLVKTYPPKFEPSTLLDNGLYILKKYHQYLDPIKVIQILPSDIPLSKITGLFISNTLRIEARRFQNYHFKRHIFDRVAALWYEKRSNILNEKIVIENNTKCSECDKNFVKR